MVAWPHRELEAHGIPMVLLETHHAARMLDAQRNKTDKNDAHGLAQFVRSGWFKPVYAKSGGANRMKLLLAHRRALKRRMGTSPDEATVKSELCCTRPPAS